MKPTGKYAYGLGDSVYCAGCYDSMEEAFADAVADAEKENSGADADDRIESVYAGEIMEFEPRIDAMDIIERMQDMASEETDGNTNGYLEDLPMEEVRLLGRMLTEAFNRWAEETRNEPNFTTLEHIVERSL